MMTSFKNTTNSEYEYKLYVGVDFGDPFYSRPEIINFYKGIGLDIEFLFLTNIEKGHVTKIWNILAKKAYDEGANYIFACGDDILFLDNLWINDSVYLLKKNNDIGLTGPLSENIRIFTQCFVGRKHIDIFGFFFPEEIKNWYCDDWISCVYSIKSYLIPQRCSNSGGKPRYNITECPRLYELVNRDRKILENYITKIKI